MLFLIGAGGRVCCHIQDCEVDFTTNNNINILLNNLKAVDYPGNTNGKSEPQAAAQIGRKPSLPMVSPWFSFPYHYYPRGLERVT